jgi:Glycosyl transferase family 2
MSSPEDRVVREAAMPPCVSLCLIAKDEEANLPTCLQSAAGLVDEIVVVDTGSSDRTREVARELGARVFDFAWVDSFAAARNESLRHATGDWILWLDGDEHFDEMNRGKLRALLDGLNGEDASFVMTQQSAPDTAQGSATEVTQVRLFRNHPQIRWSYRVHEQILPALRRVGHDVRFTDIVIAHTGYVDPILRGRKSQRNLRLLHLEEAEQPDDPFTLFNLGWAYQELGEIGEALPLLHRSLERSRPGDSIVHKLYALIAHAHRRVGKLPEALAVCRAGGRPGGRRRGGGPGGGHQGCGRLGGRWWEPGALHSEAGTSGLRVSGSGGGLWERIWVFPSWS